MQAFRQSVAILQREPLPAGDLSRGDIYHTNDRVTPFREGAAAIALAAAKRADRPVVCVPCALKCWYVTDPTPELTRLMTGWSGGCSGGRGPELNPAERVYRLANGAHGLEGVGAPRPHARGQVDGNAPPTWQTNCSASRRNATASRTKATRSPSGSRSCAAT